MNEHCPASGCLVPIRGPLELSGHYLTNPPELFARCPLCGVPALLEVVPRESACDEFRVIFAPHDKALTWTPTPGQDLSLVYFPGREMVPGRLLLTLLVAALVIVLVLASAHAASSCWTAGDSVGPDDIVQLEPAGAWCAPQSQCCPHDGEIIVYSWAGRPPRRLIEEPPTQATEDGSYGSSTADH